MQNITSWGRLNNLPHDVVYLNDRAKIATQMGEHNPGIAYGMGRSYGDVCLNPKGILWNTSGIDKFLAFDPQSGILRCEAGVLLKDIQQVMLKQGWLLPVTPGTWFATLGGAIANDVHGKNHHALGSFGNHVVSIKLVRSNGEILECSKTQNSEMFAATIGGLGLTGVIAEAEIALRKVNGAWLDSETIAFESLDEFFTLSDSSEASHEYNVAWIDCLNASGRGIFMRSNHANISDCEKPKSPLKVPLTPPLSLVNKLTLKPFNELYFSVKKRKAGSSIEHYKSFFYPLDNLLEWNRIYGRKGFYQYQSVVPRSVGKQAVGEMLTAISQAGEGSFLAVLKTFGKIESLGMLSFPQEGVTLALDFANKSEKTLKLFERLDEIVRGAGGRIYPAKDARMPRDLFESGYPQLQEFIKYRDPGISSALSKRLIHNS